MVERDRLRLTRLMTGKAMNREAFLKLLAALAAAPVLTSEISAKADSPAASSGTLAVTAKLVEIPAKYPSDDLYDYAFVMRYEVIGGELDKKSILVAHYKPRLPRAKITGKMKASVGGTLRAFNQGDVHKLQLSADLKKIWKGPLIDEFAATDRKSIRYWCLVADPG